MRVETLDGNYFETKVFLRLMCRRPGCGSQGSAQTLSVAYGRSSCGCDEHCELICVKEVHQIHNRCVKKSSKEKQFDVTWYLTVEPRDLVDCCHQFGAIWKHV